MDLNPILFENDQLKIIDQTMLPQNLKIISLNSLNNSIDAIKSLKIRGAPAIGITAAYTIFIEVKHHLQLTLLTPDHNNKLVELQ